MRCGKLLAESAPQKLLEQFQCSFLEEAFLKLCEAQNNTLNNEAERFKVEDVSSDVLSQNEYERTKVCTIYRNNLCCPHCCKKLCQFILLYDTNNLNMLR